METEIVRLERLAYELLQIATEMRRAMEQPEVDRAALASHWHDQAHG